MKTATARIITGFVAVFYFRKCQTRDYTKNQYSMDNYIKKYEESDADVPIDFYAEKDLHYKIWCIENGKYSREVWYNLMIVSLPKEYQVMLDEILA